MKGKKYLKNGLIFGIAGSIGINSYYLLLYYMGDNPVINFEYHALWIPLIFIATGIKYFKDKYNGLRLWEGITIGIMINFFTALLSGIFIYIFLNYSAPELIEQYVAHQKETFYSEKQKFLDNFSKDAFNHQIKELNKTGALILAVDDFIKIALFGIGYTILSAAYFRTTPGKKV